nr:hypothetical protein BgiMline_030406 [Biomphalaria glabrata]
MAEAIKKESPSLHTGLNRASPEPHQSLTSLPMLNNGSMARVGIPKAAVENSRVYSLGRRTKLNEPGSDWSQTRQTKPELKELTQAKT